MSLPSRCHTIGRLTTRLLSSISILFPRTTCFPLASHIQVPQVACTHKREVGRVLRRRLDQKLVPPAIQRLEALGIVDIVHQHAAVCPAVEGHAERLEALLAGRVPQLSPASVSNVPMCSFSPSPYLHRDLPVVDQDFACEEISSDGRLVASAELLVDLEVPRRLALLCGVGEMARR